MFDTDEYGEYVTKKNNKKKFFIAALIVVLAVLIVVGAVYFTSEIKKYKDEFEKTYLSQEVPKITEEEKEEDAPKEAERSVGRPSAVEADEKTEEEKPEHNITVNNGGYTGFAMYSEPADVAEAVTESVVCIQNYQTVTTYTPKSGSGFSFGFGFGFDFGREYDESSSIELAAEGSGVVISEDGYIVTNAHVVDGAELLKVMLSDGTVYQAEKIGVDVDTDLAVIKIDKIGLKSISIGDSNKLRAGEFVMAVGNPGGSDYANSVTLGIVSAVNRQIDYVGKGYTLSMIQTDTAINPGNSGGALVNLKGEMVGICSMKYVDTEYEGMGFAISVNEALPIIEDLKQYGAVKNRSAIGIKGTAVDEVTAEYYSLVPGIYVSEVTSKSAGDLKTGDVITAIDGTEVLTMQNIKAVLKDKVPGDTVEVSYYRPSEEKSFTTTVTLVELMTEEN